MSVRGEFIRGGAGQILVISHVPEKPSGVALIVFPAMCEEMNKSRRLVWQVGQDLAAIGVTTFVPDLYGTGDSQGEFFDARWSTWLDDMRCVVSHCKKLGHTRLNTLALRIGGALMTDLVAADAGRQDFSHVTLWEPIATGSGMLTKMLRAKSMAERMSGQARRGLKDLQAELYSSVCGMEVSGYLFSRELAQSISEVTFEHAVLADPMSSSLLHWGVGRADDKRQFFPENCEFIQIDGQRFWMASEPTVNECLINKTVYTVTKNA